MFYIVLPSTVIINHYIEYVLNAKNAIFKDLWKDFCQVFDGIAKMIVHTTEHDEFSFLSAFGAYTGSEGVHVFPCFLMFSDVFHDSMTF